MRISDWSSDVCSSDLAPWFERRRGLAISLALNGASLGGVLVAPPLIVLVGWLGFGPGLWVAAAIVLAILLPPVWMLLHRGPDALGLEPDGDRRPNDSHGAVPAPPMPAPSWRRAEVFRAPIGRAARRDRSVPDG